MREELVKNLENAYAPYSEFKVSAIVVTEDGKKFTGVNVENASYGATVCAERVAILKAISEGYSSFKELHVMSNSDEEVMPCFLCRQVIVEFFDKDDYIYTYDKNNTYKYKVSELCPKAFTKEDLK